MNVTDFVSEIRETTTQKDVTIYRTAGDTIGTTLRRGAKVLVQRALGSRHTVLIEGLPYYVYLR